MAWELCLVLSDYIRSRLNGHDGGVEFFLSNVPAGYRSFPVGKHASTESETVMTNSKMVKERTLRMPGAQDGTAHVCMPAHFKLALVLSVSPRLHYYDDFWGTGKVYIGYIGGT